MKWTLNRSLEKVGKRTVVFTIEYDGKKFVLFVDGMLVDKFNSENDAKVAASLLLHYLRGESV